MKRPFLHCMKLRLKSGLRLRFKNKRYGPDSAYTNYIEQKLGRSSVFQAIPLPN